MSARDDLEEAYGKKAVKKFRKYIDELEKSDPAAYDLIMADSKLFVKKLMSFCKRKHTRIVNSGV